jgi:hypothetical protein
MDFSVAIVVIGLVGYGVYYFCGSTISRIMSGSGNDDDYERDGDQVARIRHGNL